MNVNKEKETTLDDLAVMVAEGFGGVNERMDKLEGRMDKLEGEMVTLRSEMESLRSSVNNYLRLSDERYLELKSREKVIVSWVKIIAEKTGVKINFEELEKIV